MTHATPPRRPAPSRAARPSLTQVGGRAFVLTALVGRIPAATIQLGLLMFVSSAGLGVGLGGITVAAVGIGTALGAPLVGRAVDRWGPLPVVLVATLTQALGLVAVLAVVQARADTWVLVLCAAVIGAANPQVGSIARSRWSHLARRRQDPTLVRRALGYEVAGDEVGFIVGPVAASLLVGVLGPFPALWVLLAFTLVGQGAFAVYLWAVRASWDRGTTAALAAGVPRLPLAPLLAPMAACLAVGAAFGATQTGLTAVYAARGTEELTGVVYGCVGVGSAIASLTVSRFAGRLALSLRVAIGGTAVLLGALGMTALPGIWGEAGLGLVIGVGAGLMLVSGYTRAESVAPSHLIASTMTLMATALVLGLSAGAAGSGALADVLGRGFWPTVVAGLVGILAGVGFSAHSPRRTLTPGAQGSTSGA